MNQLKISGSVEFTDNISEADVLISLQSKLKKNSQLEAAARSRGIPTYVSKVIAGDKLIFVLHWKSLPVIIKFRHM